MRIAHCTAWFLPDTYGGTEIYVDALARELATTGVEQAILVPRKKPGQSSESSHGGIRIVRYELPGGGAADGFSFEEVLRRVSPDVFHLHTWTSTAGLREFRAVRGTGARTVVTLHNVAPICANETLMRFDRERCDGKIRKFTCTACYLHHRGWPYIAANAMAGFAAAMSPLFPRPDVSSRGRTLTSLFAGFQRRRNELLEMAEGAAAIVAPAEFVRQALFRNGVDSARIVLCRQGYPGRLPEAPPKRDGNGDETLRIGFVGRIDFLKGTDIIMEAVHALPPSAKVTLEVIGAVGGVAGTRRDPEKFMAKIRKIAAADSRIQLLGPMPHNQVMARMASFDLLAVPSRWQETGPMTAMEAIALGVPVLATNLGALPETVRDGVQGRIVRSLDPVAWSWVLEEVLDDRSKLDTWKRGCEPGRTMADVAGEMLALYRRILEA